MHHRQHTNRVHEQCDPHVQGTRLQCAQHGNVHSPVLQGAAHGLVVHAPAERCVCHATHMVFGCQPKTAVPVDCWGITYDK